MNRLIIVVVMFFSLPFITFSQAGKDSVLKFLVNAPIPSFQILTTDSTWFSNTDLPKGKSVAIIYFSPECGHCKAKAKFLSERVDSVKNSFFVWASYHPLNELKDFSDKFGLSKLPNIKVGRDVKYIFPPYYKNTLTPYIAIYNKRGIFSKEFRNGAMVHDIIMALNDEYHLAHECLEV